MRLKQMIFTATLCVASLALNADDVKVPQQQGTATTVSPADMPRVSEAFGNFIGKSLTVPGIQFDVDSLLTGIRNGLAGRPSPMNEEEFEKTMATLQQQAFQQVSQSNLKAANEFLQKNAKDAGVIELEPGKLQYVVIQQGSGPVVHSDSKPLIRYTGRYLNETVFGSSDDVGGPITVPLDQTIPGFSKGILNMKEGEKRKLFVHPDLGYGTGGQLLPNSLLIFDIEVVKANNETPDEMDEDSDDDEDDEDEDDEDDEDHNKPSPKALKPHKTS